MTDEDDHIAHYQRPPRKGQFKPGQSGNLRGRPPGSKNIRTYVNEHLNKKIPIIEGGKTRKAPRAEAIAIQLVNQAAKGEPKGLAAIISLTREFDTAVGELRPNVLARAEDAVVLEGIIARIRAGGSTPSQDSMFCGRPYFFMILLRSFSAAALFRLAVTTASNTSPSWSTARQR
jgi:Family of unknown function (DUF5681)